MNNAFYRVLAAGLILLAASVIVGCGGNAKKEIESTQNLKGLGEAVLKFHDDNEKWPDTLADLKPVVGTEYAGAKVGGGKSYDDLVKNPLTGDNPGYEYVKPAETPDSYEKTIVLYQLRGGKRDEKLKVGYLDGSVRNVGK
jgi:hypothetical protein